MPVNRSSSASAALAAEAIQWSPLLAAAYGIPWLGILLSAKPTIRLLVDLVGLQADSSLAQQFGGIDLHTHAAQYIK